MPALAGICGDIGYHPMGHPVLRAAIAERYTRHGIRTGPDRILVTNGAQQALSLLARAFLTPGAPVLVEAPTYHGALEAFRDAAAVLRALPVGLAGLEMATRQHRPALAYVISTFHNPTGSVLSPPARRTLAETAAATGVPLIDDEVLADLGFPGEQAPPPLAAYADTVISVGSLSKTIWAGLRIGWVRAPEPVIARLARLLAVHDLGGNIPGQLAAAGLLPRLEPLSQRRATELKARHDHLRAELARHLPDWHAPQVQGGQTLWVCLPHGDAASFAQAALRDRVAVLPGNGLDASGRSREYLRLHFLASPGDLTEATRRLAKAWHTYHPQARVTSPAALSVCLPERRVNRMTDLRGGGHHGRVDLDAFVRDGYVAIPGAVDAGTVPACRELIWAAMERRGVRRDDPGSWPPLVEDLSDLAGEPFVAAYTAPALTAAYDELIGPGRWEPSADIGESVVVRFPAEDERANAGYHIEGSYAAPEGSGAGWVNIRSRARGLLALLLFTDVGRHDAPTRLLCGSHLAVPQFLAPYGEAGTDSDADFWRPSVLCMTAAHATGRAGDVFLCHPFMVHTATWPHRGTGPRMIAQPAVNAPAGFVLDGSDPSPVAQGIVKGLAIAE